MCTQPKRHEIDEAELLARAAQAGEPVSVHQLKRLRRAGLMPRPQVAHAKGVRGSSAHYPAWAIEQLAAVGRLRRTVHRLDELVVAAWWDGCWVEAHALRDALRAPLERLSAETRGARGGEEDPYEAADLVIASIGAADGPPSQALTLIRRRLPGRADMLDLLWTFVVLGLGGEAPWEQEDRSLPDPAPGALSLMAKVMGVERAMSDDPTGSGPWLPANFDLAQFLVELRDAGGFDLEDAARPIREASEEQLARAREDARLLSGPLALIGTALEGLLGEDVAGLGSLSALQSQTIWATATLVRAVLLLRPLAGDEVFLAIAQLVDTVHARFAAIAALRAALPQHSEVLRYDHAERLAALPPAEAADVRADVARFLAERPDVARALSGGEEPAQVCDVSAAAAVGRAA